jgi:Mor family transcriptional regulator
MNALRTALLERDVQMRRERASGMTLTELAEKYKVSRARIAQVCGRELCDRKAGRPFGTSSKYDEYRSSGW